MNDKLEEKYHKMLRIIAMSLNDLANGRPWGSQRHMAQDFQYIQKCVREWRIINDFTAFSNQVYKEYHTLDP